MDQSQPQCASVMYLLFFSVSLLMDAVLCQHYYLLRPIPSDSLPLVELREDPDPVLDPRERDLNETELRGVLGDFDGRFLSVQSPLYEDKYAGNDELGDDFEMIQHTLQQQKPSGILPKEIRAVDFDVQLGKNKPYSKPSKKLKRRLQQWLWAYSFCPVAYTWTDLGARFWPRYVRVGGCTSKKRSCSVPEGMTCRPASSTHLTVLRWRCVHVTQQQQSGQDKRKGGGLMGGGGGGGQGGLRCAWIPVQYPIITDCKCACS